MAHLGDSTVGELREDVPLKPDAKRSRWCDCSEECLGGPRFISMSFGVLTAIITVALGIQICYGDYEVVPHGSVATDARECSSVGTSVLKAGGNAIDATIASAFCLAVINPHTTGLDAEGILMIYNHKTRNDPDVIDFSSDSSSQGLPRLAIGLAYVHLLYGKLPWYDLVKPAVQIARDGFLVPKNLVSAIRKADVKVYGPKEAGQTMTLPRLADTLENIAKITEEEMNQLITPQNLPIKSQAIRTNFSNYYIYVPNLPTIGPTLLYNLQIIQEHNFNRSDTVKPEYVYRLAEILNAVYKNQTIFNRYHLGTSSNVAAVDLDDTYVTLVTGMSNLFGSGVLTQSGFLLDKKSLGVPPTRLPIIITDRSYICGRRMVLGLGDVAIATQVICNLLVAGQNATSSIEQARFNFIQPDVLVVENEHEPGFSDLVLSYFQTMGKVETIDEPYSSCNMVEKLLDDLSSHSDSRGGGIASRF